MQQVILTLRNTFIRHSIRSIAHFCDDERENGDVLEELFEQQQHALENGSLGIF
jgi:hypothetical protein